MEVNVSTAHAGQCFWSPVTKLQLSAHPSCSATKHLVHWVRLTIIFHDRYQSLYSSAAERQACKLKVLGSIPSGGFISVLWSQTTTAQIDDGEESPGLVVKRLALWTLNPAIAV